MAHYLIATDDVTLTEQGNGDLLLQKGGTSVTIPASLLDTSDSTPAYLAASPTGASNTSIGAYWRRFWKWFYS